MKLVFSCVFSVQRSGAGAHPRTKSISKTASGFENQVGENICRSANQGGSPNRKIIAKPNKNKTTASRKWNGYFKTKKKSPFMHKLNPDDTKRQGSSGEHQMGSGQSVCKTSLVDLANFWIQSPRTPERFCAKLPIFPPSPRP